MKDRRPSNDHTATNTVSSSEKTEQSKYVYDLVNKWIENADNKVSISCGVFGIVYGILLFLAERITGSAVNHECLRTISKFCFIASAIIFGVSILFYVLAISPNLRLNGKNKENKTNTYYPIYYGDIAKMDLDQYLKMVDKANSIRFYEEIQREIHFNSGICLRKMRRYRIGIWTSFGFIILAAIGLATRFLMFQ